MIDFWHLFISAFIFGLVFFWVNRLVSNEKYPATPQNIIIVTICLTFAFSVTGALFKPALDLIMSGLNSI